MKILIFEGISTSGKTSVINRLSEYLLQQKYSFEIIGEDRTLMPIISNKEVNVSLNFLKKEIQKLAQLQKEVIVFDRLYFTHIFRTSSSMRDFQEIEEMLKKIATVVVVFLKIDESSIPKRIEIARAYRDKEWNEFVSRKGSSREIYQYYIQQQKYLLDNLKETSLRYEVFDATDMNFERILDDILQKYALTD